LPLSFSAFAQPRRARPSAFPLLYDVSSWPSTTYFHIRITITGGMPADGASSTCHQPDPGFGGRCETERDGARLIVPYRIGRISWDAIPNERMHAGVRGRFVVVAVLSAPVLCCIEMIDMRQPLQDPPNWVFPLARLRQAWGVSED